MSKTSWTTYWTSKVPLLSSEVSTAIIRTLVEQDELIQSLRKANAQSDRRALGVLYGILGLSLLAYVASRTQFGHSQQSNQPSHHLHAIGSATHARSCECASHPAPPHPSVLFSTDICHCICCTDSRPLLGISSRVVVFDASSCLLSPTRVDKH